jgi:hypothetical protein
LLHLITTGTSLQKKVANWELLERLLSKHGLSIDKELINDVVLCKANAGVQLLELMYTMLTNKKL